jgi:ABC-type Fe3+ transport system substrate-binding protein
MRNGQNIVLKEAFRGEVRTESMVKTVGAEFSADSQNAPTEKIKTNMELSVASEEREKWLEDWMKSVKAFIRNIDVNSL